MVISINHSNRNYIQRNNGKATNLLEPKKLPLKMNFLFKNAFSKSALNFL